MRQPRTQPDAAEGIAVVPERKNLDRRLAEHLRDKVNSTHRFGQPLELITAKEMSYIDSARARLSDLSLFLHTRESGVTVLTATSRRSEPSTGV